MSADVTDTIANAFQDKKLLTKSELLSWLEAVYPDASEETLSWRIYNMKERGFLESPGRGMYRLATREDFMPVFSNLSKRIAAMLAKELPLVNVCIWETRWLNAWMELQPAYNWTLVEAEKDTLNAIFNHLTGLSKKVYLQPNRTIMELYVLSLNEAVIVKPLVSEAPLMRKGKITTASPEKMLVDIVAEPDIFVGQQGELEHIFENMFSQILIHQNRLLRYARRRKREKQVLKLIPENCQLPNLNPEDA
ncbi:MAG TPA: hypothetical protein PKA00_15245 [Saprospiraceae bacterium]|nr:hypothetical protein [Saprospiraceae bacterium]HMQ84267.1 hypothetical protein [Saprospiraceae bacterium]